MDTPTDVLFLYDLASVSKAESEAISDEIRQLVSRMDTQAAHTDLLHYGLLRQNCHTGHGVDLKTGARAEELHVSGQLTVPHSLDRLVGLVVRRPPRERKVPGSNPACAGNFFSGVESYQ